MTSSVGLEMGFDQQLRKLGMIGRSLGFFLVATTVGSVSDAQAAPNPPRTLPPSFVCYLQTESGQVVNLSKLCGVGKSNESTFSGVDQQFLRDYQRSIKQRFRDSATATILSRSLQNPSALIQQARETCVKIQSGMQQDMAGRSDSVDGVLVKDLALAHYCPDLAD